MKYLSNFKVFEKVECYPYTLSKVTDLLTVYKFSDGNYYFRVEFDTDKEEKDAELRWLVWNGENWTYDEVPTNIFSITKTVLGNILPEFIRENEWCQSLIIKGLPKEREKSEVSQRTKTYLRYLTTNPIKGWTLDSYINEIYLDKK
jgi:hypothetical protein